MDFIVECLTRQINVPSCHKHLKSLRAHQICFHTSYKNDVNWGVEKAKVCPLPVHCILDCVALRNTPTFVFVATLGKWMKVVRHEEKHGPIANTSLKLLFREPLLLCSSQTHSTRSQWDRGRAKLLRWREKNSFGKRERSHIWSNQWN
jgi:hypothetical protein